MPDPEPEAAPPPADPDAAQEEESGLFAVPGWQACWTTCTGPGHTQSGQPREDAVAVTGANGALVAAVSDGHGSAKYFRAHIGSALAVEVATTEALAARKRWAAQVNDVAAAQWLDGEFTDAVLASWRERVSAHRAQHPFTPAELVIGGHRSPETAPVRDDQEVAARASTVPGDLENHHEPVEPVEPVEQVEPVQPDEAAGWVAYGATLLVAMATGHRLLSWQLGDGDMVAATHGQPGTPAVRPDPTLFGNQTNSLCQPDAKSHVRSSVLALDNSPALLVVASDGFGNAMTAPDWQQRLGSDLHTMLVTEELTTVAAKLPDWARQAAGASHDDVTVALLVAGDGKTLRPGGAVTTTGPRGSSLSRAAAGTTRVAAPGELDPEPRRGRLSPRVLRRRIVAAVVALLLAAGVVALVLALTGDGSSNAPAKGPSPPTGTSAHTPSPSTSPSPSVLSPQPSLPSSRPPASEVPTGTTTGAVRATP